MKGAIVLKKFYAVTQTSIYEVKDTEDGPLATKIALRGDSAIPVGDPLKYGNMLSVGHNLIMYQTETRRELSLWGEHGGHSSPVVALTLKKSDAEKCFASETTKKCDPDWAEHTKAVLRAIGKDHPNFSVPSSPSLRLMDPSLL
ncbi:MAG: hypothetical protein G01um101419_47 [Parcubacteria group bacterium Gr01-1014_19]|nr:MAG: hypothetical protein G01um101419_47 [Parcubacteria group bacterium Gr01-1014_19]